MMDMTVIIPVGMNVLSRKGLLFLSTMMLNPARLLSLAHLNMHMLDSSSGKVSKVTTWGRFLLEPNSETVTALVLKTYVNLFCSQCWLSL